MTRPFTIRTLVGSGVVTIHVSGWNPSLLQFPGLVVVVIASMAVLTSIRLFSINARNEIPMLKTFLSSNSIVSYFNFYSLSIPIHNSS